MAECDIEELEYWWRERKLIRLDNIAAYPAWKKLLVEQIKLKVEGFSDKPSTIVLPNGCKALNSISAYCSA